MRLRLGAMPGFAEVSRRHPAAIPRAASAAGGKQLYAFSKIVRF
jgi:hypothetical protein